MWLSAHLAHPMSQLLHLYPSVQIREQPCLGRRESATFPPWSLRRAVWSDSSSDQLHCSSPLKLLGGEKRPVEAPDPAANRSSEEGTLALGLLSWDTVELIHAKGGLFVLPFLLLVTVGPK